MIAGVDGARGGWVVALADDWPSPTPPTLHLAPDFAAVVALTKQCAAVALDMPIGLPCGSDVRACDMCARSELARRSPQDIKAPSRLFMVPPREAICASHGDPAEFQRLHRLHRGVGAGLPVWGIVPKIIEVDDALGTDPSLQERIVEFHPELAFAHLAGEVLPSKHTAAGAMRRLATLCDHIPDVARLAVPPNFSPVMLDDVLDALVGLSTAAHLATVADRSHPQSRRLPHDAVPTDSRGLRMEIWF
ncbi:putative RNase H-like nuclease [Desulfobaculum xiamenense]|uniref:Putative RNase H-like nuclease n=1 Tax=Desulfobaculum xiamenense TaxID=995050 RepID=A0A846QIT9_9BACT|nr:putative RNase H-like nuclease [Desulfobaculum xiamenense]